MLIDLLESKKCFKLICGAGNQDPKDVARLIAIYAKAGCKFFDVAADINILRAAKKVIAEIGLAQDEVFFCVSVATNSNIHVQKASVDNTKCLYCQECKNICPQSAISSIVNMCVVDDLKCIGCGRCAKICPAGAITFKENNQDLTKILPLLIKDGVDCIEFHINGDEGDEIFEKWNQINSLYSGILSICIGKQYVSESKMIEILSKLLKDRAPYTTIIQADGVAMSGGIDDYNATKEAIVTAQIIQGKEFPTFLMASGGTNSKTLEIAKIENVNLDGVGIGSYARKIVKPYISNNTLFSSEQAQNKAKELIDSLYGI